MWGTQNWTTPLQQQIYSSFSLGAMRVCSHCLTSPYSVAQMNIIHATGMPDRARICREPSGEYLKSG